MDYDIADSSGTDDDLLPSHNNRVSRGGRVAVNGRSVVGSVPYPRMYSDMESQIHHLEQEAYGSVLRAFKAQSDALTWEKEGLITELRKELRVSDDEHRELLTRVNADDVIHRIREWRQAGGHHGSMASTPQPVHDLIPSPTVSASRKKQKTFQSIPPSFGMPSQSLHPQSIAASMQPSSPAVKWGPALAARGKNPKHGQPLPGLSSMKSMPYPSTGPNGRGQFINHGSSGTMVTNEPAEAAICDPLIGRKLMTRWPDDNNFYKAVIKDYDPAKGLHALVYDIHTTNEAWEWVDLKEIPPEEIRWEGEDPGISRRGGHGGQGCGFKNSMSSEAVPVAGNGRGSRKGQFKNEFPSSQNGVGKVSDDIEILHTDTLIKEVERVFNVSHPDLLEIEKAKKMLKEHEQALIDVIGKLADAFDSKSDEEQPFSHGLSLDRDQGWRNMPHGANQHNPNFEADTGGTKVDGSEGGN